jgi:tRNA modification GTPase
MNIPGDTIAALATQPGEAGVAIVRVSGPGAFAVADRVFRCSGAPPSERPAGTFVYGHVVDPAGAHLDEALALLFRAPRSYTREDVVEIHGHGGRTAATRLLRSVLSAGARLAEPGEFTRRAFLSGRIDLVQAEAVLDLIRSQSDRAASAALEQLEGSLSLQFEQIYSGMLAAAAQLEATLDFPEDELPETIVPKIESILLSCRSNLISLLNTWDEGRLLRDGARVVISGKPNVGKSTLLNALLEANRAIVSPIPGTTRDTIEEDLVLGDIPIRLVDTAGLRETDCEIEAEGIKRTQQARAMADLHIYMADLSVPPDDDVLRHIAELPEGRSLLLFNKADLPHVWPPVPAHLPPERILKVSILNPTDVRHVRQTIIAILSAGVDLSARPHATISERHRQVLAEALVELDSGLEYLAARREEVMVLAASQVRLALQRIGEATGKVYHEQLLESIFSTFCIGK